MTNEGSAYSSIPELPSAASGLPSPHAKPLSEFAIASLPPVQGREAGLAISRGVGRHERRILLGEFVLLFVLDGVLVMQEEDVLFPVSPGQALLLWPDRLHWGAEDYPPGLRFFWLHFTLRGSLEEEIGQAPSLTVAQHTQVSRPDYIAELFQRYIDDQETARGRHPMSADLLVWLILCELGKAAQEALTPATTVLAGQAETYIRTHFHERIGTSVIADHIGCNPEYLSRIFRKSYGHTLTESIHRTRIEYGRRYLLRTDRPVNAIARDCGVPDVSYFVQLFKRYTGVSPTIYRRLHARTFVNTE